MGDEVAEWVAARKTLDLLRHRWEPELLVVLGAGPHRYGDLERSLPGVRSKSLVLALERMLANDLIMREVREGFPRPYPEYRLTQRGASLLGVVSALADWSRRDDRSGA